MTHSTDASRVTPAGQVAGGRQALLRQAAEALFPGGVNSPVRAFRSVGRPPLILEAGRDARVRDAEAASPGPIAERDADDWAALGCALIEVADPPSTLAVGTLQPFVDGLIERGGATHVDYVHGDEVLERLATNSGNVGIHLAAVSKSDLLRMVVREGPLPRKTFSMGEANEKRYYVEARRIGEPGAAAAAR